MDLDVKDKQILTQLLLDCRKSNTQIAKACRVSREVAAYRISQLEKSRIIQGYTCDVNFFNIGYSSYTFALKLNDIDPKKIDTLKARSRVAYLQRTMGRFDLTCTILFKDQTELEAEYDYILKLFQKDLLELETDMFLGDIDFSANFFIKQDTEIDFRRQGCIDLSDHQTKVLQQLVKNSRRSIVEMAKKISISAPTIKKIISALKKQRIILANRAILDFQKVGFHRYTLLLQIDPSVQTKIIQFAREHPAIWDIGKYAGVSNFVIEILAKDNAEFESVVKKIRAEFSQSIQKIDHLIVLEELKHEYFSK